MRLVSTFFLFLLLFSNQSLAEEADFFELVATVKSVNSQVAVFLDNERHYLAGAGSVVEPDEYAAFTVESIGDGGVTLVDEDGRSDSVMNYRDASMSRVERESVKFESKDTPLFAVLEKMSWSWGKGLLLHPACSDTVDFEFEGSPSSAFGELMKKLNGRFAFLDTGDNLLVGPESELEKMRQSLSLPGARVSVEAQNVPLGALASAIAKASGTDYWVSPSLMSSEDAWGGGSLRNVSSQSAASAVFLTTYTGFQASARGDFQVFGTAEEVEAALKVSNSSFHKLADFDYQLADLVYIYRMGAQKMGKDVLLSPSVEGTVTLKLTQASVERLLTLSLYGQERELRLLFKDDTIMIGSEDELSRLKEALASAGDRGPLVTLDYVNVDLVYLCEELAKKMDLDLEMDAAIAGSGTLTFRDRPAEEALALVLASQTPPCSYRIEGKSLRISR